MTREEVIDLYTKEILEASEFGIKAILHILITNTEREMREKFSAKACALAHEASQVSAWDEQEVQP